MQMLQCSWNIHRRHTIRRGFPCKTRWDGNFYIFIPTIIKNCLKQGWNWINWFSFQHLNKLCSKSLPSKYMQNYLKKHKLPQFSSIYIKSSTKWNEWRNMKNLHFCTKILEIKFPYKCKLLEFENFRNKTQKVKVEINHFRNFLMYFICKE